MALFKVLRGNETSLPAAKNDGWAYFCSDTGNFYIDHANSDGSIARTQINADYSNGIRYKYGNEFVEIDAADIAIKLVPSCTSVDNGKILCVVNGEATWETDLITINDIDTICGATITYASLNEGAF